MSSSLAQDHGRPNTGTGPVHAAIDLGTGHCRMLVTRPGERGGFQVIESLVRPTRLGDGLAETGRLSAAAMDRAIEALTLCAETMDRCGVTASRHVATEACRRAANGAEFLDHARAQTGIGLDCISADEEARLALAGCEPLLDRSFDRAVLFDIGGGSTEILAVTVPLCGRARVSDIISLPIGVITAARCAGGMDRDGTDADADYERFVARVRDGIETFGTRHGLPRRSADGTLQMLAASGTTTALARVSLALNGVPAGEVDGLTLPASAVRGIIARLRALSPADRRRHPGIGDRADLVLAGCAILDAIGRSWPAPRLTVADRGVREGLVVELMAAEGLCLTE